MMYTKGKRNTDNVVVCGVCPLRVERDLVSQCVFEDDGDKTVTEKWWECFLFFTSLQIIKCAVHNEKANGKNN